MNILILDDNEAFADRIRDDLYYHFSGLWDRTYFDRYTKDFSQLTFHQKYDMAFFDIDLCDEDGIRLAKELKQLGLCKKIIFVTAHAHLVYDSLAVRPYFFIRKNEYQNDLKILFSLLDDEFKEKTLLTLKYHGSKQVIQLEDIVYLETMDHVLDIHTLTGAYKDYRLLKDFLMDVPDSNFVQIHKSYAINLDYLLSYNSTEVNLAGNVTITIGRFYKKQFIQKYQEYLLK